MQAIPNQPQHAYGAFNIVVRDTESDPITYTTATVIHQTLYMYAASSDSSFFLFFVFLMLVASFPGSRAGEEERELGTNVTSSLGNLHTTLLH